jgi:hypothetical protein
VTGFRGNIKPCRGHVLICYSSAPILLRGLGYVAGSRIDRPPLGPARYPGTSACAEFYPLIFGANLEASLRFDGFALMRCGSGRCVALVRLGFPKSIDAAAKDLLINSLKSPCQVLFRMATGQRPKP